ncbi:MAG: hypothetical protein AB8G99_03255 [Planctomycetaceae bacterium]
MHVPRIWKREYIEDTDAHGNVLSAFGWGWSDSSEEEARSRASATARRVMDWLIGGNEVDDPHHYGYDERLPREEIVREFVDAAGTTYSFITRNSYGSLVLNARDLVFIDVDLPDAPKPKPVSLLARLFGKKPSLPSDPSQVILDEIRATARLHDDLGFRIYRTANGFRVAISNQLLTADSPRVQQLLSEFGADLLYVRMCKNQQCFRARLTPKAWRCGAGMPPGRYPFGSSSDEAEYRTWESQYTQTVSPYSVCQLVESIGPAEVHPELDGLIKLHDELTKCRDQHPLA